MDLPRREFLAATAAIASLACNREGPRPGPAATASRRGDFLIPDGLTYLNSAYTHPMPRAGVELLQEYAARRAAASGQSSSSSPASSSG